MLVVQTGAAAPQQPGGGQGAPVGGPSAPEGTVLKTFPYTAEGVQEALSFPLAPDQALVFDIEEFDGKPDLLEALDMAGVTEFMVPYTGKMMGEYDNALIEIDVNAAAGQVENPQAAPAMPAPTHTMPDGSVMPGATHGESMQTPPSPGGLPGGTPMAGPGGAPMAGPGAAKSETEAIPSRLAGKMLRRAGQGIA